MRSQADFRAMLGKPNAASVPVPAPLPAEPQYVAGEPEGESDWSSLVLTRGQLSMQPAMLLGIVKQSACELRSITLADCGKYVDDEVVLALVTSCSNLRSLDISNCDVSDRGLLQLAECASLEELSVAGCALSDTGINAILSNCNALVALDCRGCDQLSAAAFLCDRQSLPLNVAATQQAWEQSLECEDD